MSLFDDFQKLFVSDLVFLMQLTPASGGNKIYFTNNPNGAVVFDKVLYLSIGCDIDGVRINSQGEFKTATLTMSDENNVASTLIEDDEDRFEKSVLEIYITREIYLDGRSTSDVTAIKLLQKFNVSQIRELIYGKHVKISLTNYEWMSKEIGRYAMSKCPVKYRGKHCRYNGRYYDINNNPTDDPELDDCDRSVNACNIRHGGGVLPWKGFLISRT
jgi:lambda family phage minor tail protein L